MELQTGCQGKDKIRYLSPPPTSTSDFLSFPPASCTLLILLSDNLKIATSGVVRDQVFFNNLAL